MLRTAGAVFLFGADKLSAPVSNRANGGVFGFRGDGGPRLVA